MLQFLKGSWHYGELDAVKAFGDNFVMKQMGRGFVKVGGAETDPEDVRLVEEAWAEAEKEILSGQVGPGRFSTRSTTPSATRCSTRRRSSRR